MTKAKKPKCSWCRQPAPIETKHGVQHIGEHLDEQGEVCHMSNTTAIRIKGQPDLETRKHIAKQFGLSIE